MLLSYWGGPITRDRFWDLRLALFWGLPNAVVDANSKNYLSIVLKFRHTRRKPNILPYGFTQQGSVFFAIVENIINLQLLGWTLGTNIGNSISLPGTCPTPLRINCFLHPTFLFKVRPVCALLFSLYFLWAALGLLWASFEFPLTLLSVSF